MADKPGHAVQSPPGARLPVTPPTEAPKPSTSASRRVRARLARRMTAQRSAVNPVLEPLVAIHREIYPKANLQLLQRAYEVAEERHANQLRKSGDPYITHPLAVAHILAELGMDTTTLIAALLHDTVEDTGYTLEELTAEFGSEVAHLVDGVTKLDKVALGTAAEGETIRKMIIAMARDARVLVIKVADRLHNMRTMRFLPPEKQQRKARETLEVIAPLAHRLGMATVKWELEDLSFAILHPKKYEEIVRLVADRAPSRDTYLAKVRAEIAQTLQASKINAVVEGRPKHYWSIYQKMIVKGRDFDDIHDLVGVRILCDEIRDCYAALGVVHSLWQPMAGRFKDYIAQPRYGVYQSLHTTVVGPEGKPLEVQIRTHDMHKTAELGIAAHWRYKENKGRNGVPNNPHAAAEIDEMAWMRQLLDWQREAADPGEFLESLRYDLAVQEIFVFTPKGDVITLPAGSTPVDFAYAVHTEVGHRCIGARVNGRLVALERKLENGEVVEVFTSKAPNAGPSRDWQSFVVSPRAKAKIRQWFAKERREEALEAGKDAIAREVRRGGLPLQRLMNAETMGALARELRYADVSALYTAVGEGHVSARHVVQRLVALVGGDEDAADEIAERSTPATMPVRHRTSDDVGVAVPGAPGVLTKLAKCCTPVPGDNILGFVTRGGGVSVHRTDCTNAKSLQEQSERIIEVKWAPSPSSVFLVAIQVEALDRHRLLSDVTRVLADEKVNILSAQVTTSNDRVAISRFTFEMGDPKHLGHVLNVVRNVEGVYDVYRVTSAA
ncbi:(p)ppGpp synthetase, RelA/SpoT family [Mycolicibacterium phlei]|jgi:guanosine-3',5'-bis(diphosphate) 3'-pyrophosphohydrolase|uniref:GTP diphosphokinase n=2 Tax=Mycolicibacterium phlei TaxID=1771 RepID=A0A5N5VAL0_MYCPH|nr:RelA/SpoT family protein [Mycolicibacterium phlei]VEG09932.1 (p)ppGpp synthetase, RelA/SpoT family [Mycobacteroides chelonae]AMO61825.1 Bifunctional (p)ppGpp synthase/hydrolase relA [Mycolicibacterium phlei]KAB7758808.1 Guanosine-3',5'-bis(Diphosphate) 3'-pyrophosphohydrolase [Mycolicibacterium phlei DSM 43239 = CCUG 21000]KXW67292.1 Guanosine-3',5'-bis(Diphosphate) 3'-pyrophosphohydrolase [Mycolicibacterium phlei DSM 43239 = CCUG 21000]KXW71449.1 GTP pyrophosphokinase [Mycolicibacterium ph